SGSSGTPSRTPCTDPRRRRPRSAVDPRLAEGARAQIATRDRLRHDAPAVGANASGAARRAAPDAIQPGPVQQRDQGFTLTLTTSVTKVWPSRSTTPVTPVASVLLAMM